MGLARSLCEDVEFSPEDATRTDLDFLCAVVEAAIDAGASTINIPDTVGYTTPREFTRIIETIRATVRGTGAQIDCPIAHVFSVRDGKIVSWEGYSDTVQVAAAHAPQMASAGR